MTSSQIKRPAYTICSFIGLVYFLCYFGQPEKTSSRIVYLITGVFAIFAFIMNQAVLGKGSDDVSEKDKKYRSKVLLGFAALFGVMVVVANYEHYMNLSVTFQLISIVLLFLSAGVVFINIFKFCDSFLAKHDIAKQDKPADPAKWFVISFTLLAVFYMLVFFLCSYPGQICSDSMNQIHQIVTGNYSNHHPVYQTWIIGFFYNIGMSMFQDINAAVATYTIFQIIFMSATFAFMISTIIEAGGRRIFAAGWLIWFLITPCHIIFSFTLWKDSLYGAVVCLFIVYLYRIFKKLGKRQSVNYAMLFLTGVGFNLLRSNGLPAFLLLIVIFAVVAVITKKIDKKILFAFLASLIVALIMKFPMLKAMNIPQADTVEMLSIPVQQVTRIARENYDFTSSERAVIDQVASIERMEERYNPRIYDYARDVIRYEGNQQYIKDHPFQCLGTWFTIVIRHPVLATRAWVDQTSGYWNPCSYYWMKWWDGVCEEDGLRLIINSQGAYETFHKYVRWFTDDNAILVQTYNVGLHVWIILFCFVYCIYYKRKNVLFSLPVLCLVATLLIATLMHDEFRFGYPIYTCLPIIVFSALARKEKPGNAKDFSLTEMIKDKEPKAKSTGPDPDIIPDA
ncbi:MAG: hypothetical protein IKZ29_09880 [Clostridiales bacterium]|nr:hypothetical protein [Clostridiales bacterium]